MAQREFQIGDSLRLDLPNLSTSAYDHIMQLRWHSLIQKHETLTVKETDLRWEGSPRFSYPNSVTFKEMPGNGFPAEMFNHLSRIRRT